MIHVVIGLIYNMHGQILIAQRLSHQEKAGLWELPGGKVEAGETAFIALQRELQEEVGIAVTTATPLLQVEHEYPNKAVLLDTWRVTQYDGQPYGAEGQPIQWCDVKHLSQYTFPEGNRKIITKLLDEIIDL